MAFSMPGTGGSGQRVGLSAQQWAQQTAGHGAQAVHAGAGVRAQHGPQRPTLQVTDREPGPVSFAVPSGNFGNVFSGHLAKQMGVPIFLLVPQVKLRKRLDLARDAERAIDAVPGRIVAGWVESRF